MPDTDSHCPGPWLCDKMNCVHSDHFQFALYNYCYYYTFADDVINEQWHGSFIILEECGLWFVDIKYLVTAIRINIGIEIIFERE